MKTYLLPFITLALGLLIGTRLVSPMSLGSSEHSMNTSPKTDATTPAPDAHVEKAVDPSLPLPSAKMTLQPDTMGGYNLQVELTNFTLTPQDAGSAPKANEGHMHIYINGTKVGRMYGEWMYLKADLFSKEANQIDVTLNANDHTDWMHEGKHIGDSATVPPHKGASVMMHK